jgi:hypothetical protein
MFMGWLAAFAFTVIVEAPVYRWALARRPEAQRGRATGALRPWLWAAGLSLPTHPVVWFVFPRIWPGGWLDQTLAAEAFAVGVEAALLARLGVSSSLGWALAANGLSVALGLGARWAWGWP